MIGFWFAIAFPYIVKCAVFFTKYEKIRYNVQEKYFIVMVE